MKILVTGAAGFIGSHLCEKLLTDPGNEVVGVDTFIGPTPRELKQYNVQNPNQKLRIEEIPFTRKELREFTGWSETQIRQNIEPLVELGYLGRLSGRQGSACRYVLLDDGADDPQMCFDEKSTS